MAEPLALDDWSAVLAKVDATAPTWLTTVQEKIVAAGWDSPTSVVRAQPGDVLESLTGLNGPQKTFVRRTVDKVNEMEKKAKALENAVEHSSEGVVPFASQGSVEHRQSMHSLLGNETSALAVAEALAAGGDTLDVSMVLKEAKLENVTDSFCSSKDVFAELVTAQKAAEKLVQTAFPYVELTHASVLSEFLPPEAVGAKTTLPGQDEVLARMRSWQAQQLSAGW